MKLNELKKREYVKVMPMGKSEITFDHLEYRVDSEENINGIWIYNKEFKPLFVPFFQENNFQLDLLLEQLGVESYDPDEINKAYGKKIIAIKYQRNDEIRGQVFTNISFNKNYKEKADTPTYA